jgi:ankyrin repeat protein
MQTPLHIAASLKRDGVAEVLLAAGAAVDAADSSGTNPLHIAAEKSYGRMVQRLLAAGAEMEAWVGPGKWTPLLHYAASKGAVGPIGLLVGAGTDLHAVAADGSRPLHLAAGPACLEAVRLLIRLGASPSLKNQAGVSAIKSSAAGDASALSLLRSEAAAQRRCATCGGTEGRLQRCARCQIVLYRSTACQRQHWPHHKQRCQPLAQPPGP